MKSKILISYFIILFPISISAKVCLTGKVFGSSDKNVYLYYPINGFANGQILQSNSTFKLDSSNKFQFAFDINDPTFITLKINQEPIWLAVKGNDTIDISVHLDSIEKTSHKGWLTIKGTNSKGHLYFNEYNFDLFNKYILKASLF